MFFNDKTWIFLVFFDVIALIAIVRVIVISSSNFRRTEEYHRWERGCVLTPAAAWQSFSISKSRVSTSRLFFKLRLRCENLSLTLIRKINLLLKTSCHKLVGKKISKTNSYNKFLTLSFLCYRSIHCNSFKILHRTDSWRSAWRDTIYTSMRCGLIFTPVIFIILAEPIKGL